MDRTHQNLNSLPAWTYVSEGFFALEARHVLKPAWQLVCHRSNVPKPGDFVTFDFLNERAVVVRGHDGEIRAFHNVCRHRNARLLDGPGGNAGKDIVCPYHAWVYDLDGTLTRMPFEDDFWDFDRSCNGLKPIELEDFFGFQFIRFQGNGPSVAEQFAPYLDDLSHYRLEELQPLGRITMRSRAANWKTIADNYVDALHVDVAHPGLKGLFGNSYSVEVKGDVHKMSGDLMETRKDTLSTKAYKDVLPTVDWLPADRQRHWCYYRLWPNLALDIYPDQVDFMQFIPVSATETMIREIPFAVPDDRREMRAARYLNWRINRQVNAEDAALIDRVQEGMASGAFQTGPFASREKLLIDSAERMRHAIPVASGTEKPTERELLDMAEKGLAYGR